MPQDDALEAPPGLGAFLHSLGLGEYEATFAANGVELDTVALLSEADLAALGLLLGHRKKLLSGLAALAPSTLLGRPAPRVPSDATAGSVNGGARGNEADSERRQLTVLFCDLVGFTELSGRVDPEVLQRIVRVYENVCEACIDHVEGYVAKHLGDGILAFFGYPLAHEGEAERAIVAALEIVDTLSTLEVAEVGRLHVRIGIASGVVVVSTVDNDAWGEAVNLASRLQGVAPVDGIVVSDRVHRLAAGRFLYDDLGEQSLKGIAAPVRTYQVRGSNPSASRFEAATHNGLTELVGREDEIRFLLDRWALVREGEGQIITLSGESGIGKSRVLSAFRDHLREEGTETLRLQCTPYHANSALWPSIDSFDRALKFRRDETAAQRLDKLEHLLVERRGLPLSDVRHVAWMLSIPCADRYGELEITPQQRKLEILRCLIDLTESAARVRPTVLFYEDVHWADPTSLEAVDLLVERVQRMRLLAVITHRPEFPQRWGGRAHVSALHLSKLTGSESGQIVSALTGGRALPPDLYDTVLEKTDGVPLYLEELTKSVLESGALVELGDRFEYAGADRTVAIPATLRDLLSERLDRHSSVKEIAQIGAAIGRDFSYELIAAVSQLGPVELGEALAQLTESGIAYRRGWPPDATYTFKHALVQEAAYDSMLMSRRQLLHGRIAHVLETTFTELADAEPERLAHHLSEAGRSAEAARTWMRAGTQSTKRLAFKEATSQLGRGLQLLDDVAPSPERDAQELEIRTLLGTAWLALEGWQSPGAWDALNPAMVLARKLDRHEALMPVYWGLWVYVLTKGQIEEADERVAEIMRIAEQTGDPDLLMTGHRAASVTDFYRGRFQTCCTHADLVRDLYDEKLHHHIADIVNTDPVTAVGIFESGALWMLGLPDQAVALSNTKDEHARRRAHPFDLGYALTWGGQVWDLLGRTDRLLERVQEAEHIGSLHRLPFISDVLAQLIKGIAWIRSGRVEEGIPHFETAMQRWTDGGSLALLPYYRSVLAEGYAASGDPRTGLRLLQESIEQILRPGWGERSHYAEVLRLRGQLLRQIGELGGADDSFTASLAVAREQCAKSWELRTAASQASLWASCGRTAEAAALLAPVVGWFTEGLATRDVADAQRLLRQLSAPTNRAGEAGVIVDLNGDGAGEALEETLSSASCTS